jgi:hypothetical protein
VLADPNEVRIVDGAQVLACHRRSYDKEAVVQRRTPLDHDNMRVSSLVSSAPYALVAQRTGPRGHGYALDPTVRRDQRFNVRANRKPLALFRSSVVNP